MIGHARPLALAALSLLAAVVIACASEGDAPDRLDAPTPAETPTPAGVVPRQVLAPSALAVGHEH